MKPSSYWTCILQKGVCISQFNANKMFYFESCYAHVTPMLLQTTIVTLTHLTNQGVSKKYCLLLINPEECAQVTAAVGETTTNKISRNDSITKLPVTELASHQIMKVKASAKHLRCGPAGIGRQKEAEMRLILVRFPTNCMVTDKRREGKVSSSPCQGFFLTPFCDVF